MQSSISTVLSAQAHTAGRLQITSVQNVADVLASMMADIHGGSWEAIAEHGANASFVLVKLKSGQSNGNPKRGEAV